MAQDDSAELIIDGRSRRVAMDITRLEPKSGADQEGTSRTHSETAIEGEIHDQEDLNGIRDAVLKIDGAGTFKISFYTPTRFRGAVQVPAG